MPSLQHDCSYFPLPHDDNIRNEISYPQKENIKVQSARAVVPMPERLPFKRKKPQLINPQRKSMSAVAGVAQGDNQSPAPLRNPAAEGAAHGEEVWQEPSQSAARGSRTELGI